MVCERADRPATQTFWDEEKAMAQAAEEQFPESFVRDTAKVIRAIEDIPHAAAVLADRPLDVVAQERMRRVLDPTSIGEVNAAAGRIVSLRVSPDEGV